MYVLSKKHKSVFISVLYLDRVSTLPFLADSPSQFSIASVLKVVVIGKLLLQSYNCINVTLAFCFSRHSIILTKVGQCFIIIGILQ